MMHQKLILPPPPPDNPEKGKIGARLAMKLAVKCLLMSFRIAAMRLQILSLRARLEEYDKVKREANELRAKILAVHESYQKIQDFMVKEYGIMNFTDPVFTVTPAPMDGDNGEELDYDDDVEQYPRGRTLN